MSETNTPRPRNRSHLTIQARRPLASYSDAAYRLLGQWLDVDTGLLQEALEAILAGQAYESFRIPKPGRDEWRVILDPYGGLKEVQRRILDRLLYPIPVSNAAHGAVPGRSVVTNARQHLPDAQEILSIDLRHAFPSVRFSRVHSIFRKQVRPLLRKLGPLPTAHSGTLDPVDEVIHLLAGLTTYKQTVRQQGRTTQVYCLPQGAPTSGYLLNLACLPLDGKIYKIIEKNPELNLRYSRYLDDLVVSSPNQLNDEVQKEVELAVVKSDFHLNHQKIARTQAPAPLVVCGVQLSGEQLTAEGGLIERCADMLRNAEAVRNPTAEQKLRRKIRGVMVFFRQVYGQDLPPNIAEPYQQYRTNRQLPEEPETVAQAVAPVTLATEPSNAVELLAQWLDLTPETIAEARAKIQAGEGYESWSIDKGNGSKRIITSPVDQLKDIQTRILSQLIYHIPVSNACHGFVPGRSIVTNAMTHQGATSLINLDLKDAFPSVSKHRVELGLRIGLGRVIKKFGLRFPRPMRDELIALLGELLTVDDQLPQGAPTSGYLLNIAAMSLDKRLFELIQEHDQEVTYTRYADDLTFTCKDGELTTDFLNKLKRVIRRSGFRWNPRKTHRAEVDKGQQIEICGIYVDDDGLRLPRDKMKAYRSILRRAATQIPTGQLDDATKRQIQGVVGFVEMVYGELPRRISEPYQAYLQQHPDARPKRLYRDKISFYPNIMPNP
ncbi:MAG: RNA-directed DNA polymerase [Deltaproteobacteria bacterium]|nr:MAG: RNA-directed DNA polymerase [Deltaproteobacteria bacterium]